ncbi:NmrA-like family protein [Calocera viscosa TUFC12733]|uniref:NmrA-like family protein n=1 Tax=Calocera viscosa (strain TUFC12733) TaxID=1330018 RepID=A0A167I905_CALVF|nr:NmrA-like family protein [Calocera viscosa TUFC12733]
MIVVTGATGGLGSQVFKYLLQLLPASQITVSLHNPSGASEFIKTSGAQIRQGSYTDSSSLDSAWAKADKLFLISYPGISREPRVAAHKSAIDAAKRLSIGHVYYTSLGFGTGISPESVADVMQAHLETERYLKQSGLKYTIIREGIYSESWPLYLGFWSKEEGGDEVIIPNADGPIAWVSREDLGEATAKIIAEGAYGNETIFLSGARTYTLTEIVSLISSILSRALKIKVGTVDDYVTANQGKRGPRGEPAFLQQWATTYTALAKGECSVVDQTIKRVLGRELKPMEQTLREMLGVADDSVDRYAK